MIKINKGFTFPELIIVISFFAIVFAIVIPALITLNKKVEMAEDVALVELLNEALEECKTEGPIKTYAEFALALESKGYVFSDLETINEKYHFVWESETNQILLVEYKNQEYKVLYSAKEGYGEYDESWHFSN